MSFKIPLALAVALLALVVLLGSELLVSRGVVHRGVTFLGTDLGGLPPAAARAAVQARGRALLETPVTVTAGAQASALVPREAGVRLDVEATERAVWQWGRKGSWLGRIRDRLALWRAPVAVAPVLDLDGAVWQATVDDLALRFERLPRDARLTLTPAGPKAVAAETGLVIDREVLARSLLTALETGRGTIPLPLREVPPRITTADAQRALRMARTAFSAPITLGYQEHRFMLTPQQLSRMAEVNPGGLASGLPLIFDTPQGRDTLEALLRPLERPAVDAVIVPTPSGKGFTVEPSRPGTRVEWDAVFAGLARAALDPTRRYVAVATAPAYPKLTTEDAEQLGVRREIAAFTTYFSPSNQARVHNIQQVAALLDGTVVRPGEVFSFNTTVGPRTKAAGYDEAPVIRDGVLTPGVGGGICQVSTTLFNAVFFAGLPVLERKPHSFYIDHYPVGRDATVSYGTTDFKFKNDSSVVLLVSARADERSVTVSLAAPSWDRVVTYQTTPFYDIVEPRSSAEKPRRLRDPSLPPGTSSALEAGVSGRSVEVKRTVSAGDGRVLFKDAFFSRYEPKDYIIRVGG
ncbi:MAG: VanW family protein [Thermoleophilia bacterium]